LISLLRNNADVFAWDARDLGGISRDIIEHWLQVDPSMKLRKQCLQKMSDDKIQGAKAEVQCLLDARIIQEVQFLEWLANVVMVPKKNGKWCMCINFTDLNKVCLKDDFPLTRIDKLVDKAAGCEMMSLLDFFSGYHQIWVAKDDEEKTSFIIPFGTYCFVRMPEGLKNAVLTFCCMTRSVFKDQEGRNILTYVDDIIVISKMKQQHPADLIETFESMREVGLKLNPAKCVFGVDKGRILGCLVSARGIEANPDKIKAIINMKPAQSVKDVQKLTCRIAALNHFISRSAERSLPLFAALRCKKSFEWTEQHQQAVDDLKAYLTTLTTLASPEDSEPLLLYIAASPAAVSAALVQEREVNGQLQQLPVYFVSEALSGSKLLYSELEKMAYAVIMVAQKLKHYFEGHHIRVLTDRPLADVFSNKEASHRISKWAMELSECVIDFEKRKAIKSQILADFIVDWTGPSVSLNSEDAEQVWTCHCDGAWGSSRAGAASVITSPFGILMKYALRLQFQAGKCTNNIAEYEAVLLGLRKLKALGAQKCVLRTDSKVVADHIEKESSTRDPDLAEYLNSIRSLE
jgi:hypothetical protein